WFSYLSSAEMRALGLDNHRVQTLARNHEQPVSLGPAKSDVRTLLRQPDHPDPLSRRSHNLHTRLHPAPQVSIRIATQTVHPNLLPGSRHVEVDEFLPVLQRLPIHVVDPRIQRRAC